jgi:ABC-type transporter Mla MlaB component
MGFLDQISKQISQGVDRAKFEADKFQKTTRLQGEANELRRQIDTKLSELGQRAYDLQRAGQISSASLAELANVIDQLRSSLVGTEEELKQAQAEVFVEPPPAPEPSPMAQQVPISYEPTPAPAASHKICGVCNFQMPASAMFCPNCGTRVA